jgi:outer membrane protein OmpA-like peptidoglycan-associated protein
MKLLISILFLVSGFCLRAQPLLLSGKVLHYKTGLPIPATVVFEKKPDASVTVISKSDASGYHARIYYRAEYRVKVSSPGFVNEYRDVNLNLDSALFQTKWDFSLVPIHLNEVLPFSHLLFEVGSARVLPQSFSELDRLAEILGENPGIRIRLEGHTDNQGKGRKSMRLAKRRIASIREYLIGKGINGARIKMKAFGGQKPLSQSDAPEAHRANRRVEIRVIGMDPEEK